MTRVILVAGKGGVGKSTVAAATAAVCAARGQRVLAMSIDSAHNLSDLFDSPLGHLPTPVTERLFALEVDLNRELADNWGSVIDFFRTMTANDPRVSEMVAEECAVFPGMEEVFGLMRLQSVVETGEFEVVVVDAPPTADMLKFLRLPDVLRWFMEKYHPLDRGVVQRVRPLADALKWPVPNDAALAEMEHWYARVRQASATLRDLRSVSVRLVMNPDRVSLAETRRSLAWTCLFGMNVDAVIVNKILPEGEYPPFFAPWVRRQAEVLAEAEGDFAGLPLLRAALRSDEVMGAEALREFGAALVDERAPAGLWSSEPPLRWEEDAGGAELSLRLPFLSRDAFRLLSGRDGLTLFVGNQRRLIPLPGGVLRREMLGARYEAGWLRVRFGPAPAELPEAPGPTGKADRADRKGRGLKRRDLRTGRAEER